MAATRAWDEWAGGVHGNRVGVLQDERSPGENAALVVLQVWPVVHLLKNSASALSETLLVPGEGVSLSSVGQSLIGSLCSLHMLLEA